MRIIGFHFSKIYAERISDSVKDLKLETNIDISNIDVISSDILTSKEEVLEVKFTFFLNYEPNFAKLSLNGGFLVEIEKEKAKIILKEWKNKNLSEENQVFLMNVILRKCSIKALNLEEELGLPLHMSMPNIGVKKE